jgi:hypothetical protein
MPTGEGHAHAIADGDERLTDFGLEENDDGDADVEKRAAQDEFEGHQLLIDGQPVEQGEGGDGRRHRGCARASNQPQDRIHDDGDQYYIQEVPRLAQSLKIFRVWQNQQHLFILDSGLG